MLPKHPKQKNPVSLFVKRHGIYIPKSYKRIERFCSLKEKTIWDWLQLLIVPVLLTVGGFTLNWQADLRQERLSEERRKQGERLAEERWQKETLNSYLDKMSELLVDKGLFHAKTNSEVFILGQSRTTIALRQLDLHRKGLLFDFLRSADLLSPDGKSGILRESILAGMNFERLRFIDIDLQKTNLERANLNEIIITQANLEGANLSYANIWNAGIRDVNLKGAYLARTNFREALLVEVDLQKAILWKADFSKAGVNKSNLRKADLMEARLIETSLVGCNFEEANLERAYMWKADLREVNLKNANLKFANLSGASLVGVNLSGTNLTDTQLFEADFSNSRSWTDRHLSLAKLCKTKLPSGSNLNPDRDCKELKSRKNR